MKKTMFKKRLMALVLTILLVTSSMAPGMADTEVSASKKPILHPLGLAVLHEKIPGLEMAPKTYSASLSLPTSVDLSSKLPAPGDQGSLGSCVAWATGYAYKSFQEGVEHSWSLSTNDHLFSPAYIYNQIHINNTADGGGSYFSTAFDLLKNQGCTTLSDMPYNGNSYAYNQTPTAQQKANAARYKAKSWSALPDGDYNEVKAHLSAGDAVVIGIPVYPDFEDLNSSNPIYDNTSGTSRGGHALCVVGYDDNKKAVKIINSWTNSWGINGYGWISYDLISRQQCELYVMTDIIDNPTPTPTTTPSPTSTPIPTPVPTPIPGGKNIALNKPVNASDYVNAHQASYAVDGNTSSYWAASSYYDQTLSVDLGTNYTVSNMSIRWSTNNYPGDYDIQAWNGSRWQTVKSVVGSGDLNTIRFSSPVTTSKFRVYCTNPNASYFTIYEWEIYSTTPNPTPVPTPVPTTTPVPTPVPDNTNLAAGKVIKASDAISSHPASYAVDGNASTYWAANSNQDQYIFVDLGASHKVNAMEITWSSNNYPGKYVIQTWNGSSWQNLQSFVGSGGANKISFTKPANARYFRIYCLNPNSYYYTIYEWKVFGN